MDQTDLKRRAELAQEVLKKKWYEPQKANEEDVNSLCAFCNDGCIRAKGDSMCSSCLVPKDLCDYRLGREKDGLLGLHCELWCMFGGIDDDGFLVYFRVRDLPIWTFQYIRKRLKQMVAEGSL